MRPYLLKVCAVLTGLLVVYGLFALTTIEEVGAQALRVFTAPQGGTGIGSVTGANIGQCLKVLTDSPFTYELGPCGSGGGGGSSDTNWLWNSGTNIITSDGASTTATTSVRSAAFFADSTTINSTFIGLTATRSTTSAASSTNLFSSILTATTGFITDLLGTRATITSATTTNLRASGSFSFGGVVGTAWTDFCTAITGGAGLCDGTDSDTTYTAGDALTLTGNDIDFDGGVTPSGDLGGTWATPSVTDDSHAHTGSTLSGVDISDDTNLTADGTEIVLTGDALSLGTALTFTNGTSTNSFQTANLYSSYASTTYSSSSRMSLYGPLFDRTASAGTNGMVLQTNGSGITWVATNTLGFSGGSGTPGGSDTQLQYNNGGSFGGVTELTYDDVAKTLNYSGTVSGVTASLDLNPTQGWAITEVAGPVYTGSSEVYQTDVNLIVANGGLESRVSVDTNGIYLKDTDGLYRIYNNASGTGSTYLNFNNVTGTKTITVPNATGTFLLATNTQDFNLGSGTTTVLFSPTLLGTNATATSLGVLSLNSASCDVKATTGGGLYCGIDQAGSGSGIATSGAIADTEIVYGTSASTVDSESAFTYNASTDLFTGINSAFTRASSTYSSTTALSVYGPVYDRTGSAGTSGMVLQTNGSGATWVATNTLGFSAGAGDGVSNWTYNGNRLSPSTTVGIGVFASSTVGDGTATGGLTINGSGTTTGTSTARTLMVGNYGNTIQSGILEPAAFINASTSGRSGVLFQNYGTGTAPEFRFTIGDPYSASQFEYLSLGLTNSNAITPGSLYGVNKADLVYILSNTGRDMAIGSGAGDLHLGTDSTAVGLIQLDHATQRVLIGSRATSTPTSTLTVNGNIFTASITATGTASSTYASTTATTLYGQYYDTNSSAGTNNMVLTSTGTSTLWRTVTASGDGVSNWLFNGSRLSPSTTVGIGVFASSTIGGGTGATGLTVSGTATATALVVPALTSALTLTDGQGLFAEYAGTTCTNQFVRSLSVLGAATCASISASDMANGDHGFFTYAGNVATVDSGAWSSANLASYLTDETGTGNAVFSASPVFTGTAQFAGLTVSGTSTLGFASSTALTVSNNAYLNTYTAAAGTTTAASSTNLFATIFTGTTANIATLLGTNAVFTGLVNIGAGVLQIPNGANPTVDSIGELAIDTTGDQVLVADTGGTPRVVIIEDVPIWSVTVASTSVAFANAGILPAPTRLDGFTITRIQCHVLGGTSKVIAVEDASANSSEDITCATTNTTDDGSITNATFTASELPFIDFGATSGVVDYVTISVFGNWTRE